MQKTKKVIKSVWKKWLKIARIIGNFQARVFFSLFYLILFLPVGLAFRLFSDPLHMKKQKSKKTNFHPWEHPKEDLKQARMQY